MSYDNEGLVILKQKADRKEFLSGEIRRLNKSRYEVRSGVIKLEHIMEEEQADVDKLKKPGVTSFFYNLTGKYEEKFNKEYLEAREASDKYKTAAQELAKIDDELQRAEHEFRELGDIEREYKQAFEEKVKLIIEANMLESKAVSNLDSNVRSLQKEIKDMDAMQLSGRDVLSGAKHLELKLEEAYEYERRARFDDEDYHNRARARACMEQATSLAVTLSERLYTFKELLINISAFAKNYADISAFSRFLDWNFSGSTNSDNTYPKRLLCEIEPVLTILDSVNESIEKKYAEVYNEFEILVLKVLL